MKMSPRVARWTERGIGAFKYLIAGYMMLAGIVTMFAPGDPTVTGAIAFIYTARLSLVIIGILIFLSGFTLFWGKVRKSKKWVGHGLMYVYLCFLFAAGLNFVAYHDVGYWIGNLVVALITGALWLRWKFKTQYINPNHFARDIEQLTE